jgi:polyisoprenoid-binding protein YceI
MADLSNIPAGTWTIDPAHSTVSFVARHLMISKVRGTFASFSGTITVADDRLASTVQATVDMASVRTNDDGRDAHLKGPDFFDSDVYPTMTFASDEVFDKGSYLVVRGDLTIKGVTRRAEFDVEVDGVNTDPWGNTKLGLSATTEINRKDWGLEWNVALETGGVLVGDKVKIELDLQAVEAKA